MKTIRVDLRGEERLEREASIFIGVPDDVNDDGLRELGAEFFQRLADESAADWETNDSSGIEILGDEDGLVFTEVEGSPDVVAVLEHQVDGKLGLAIDEVPTTGKHKIETNEATAYGFVSLPPNVYAKANGIMLEEFPAMNEVMDRLTHLPPKEKLAWGQLLTVYGQRLMELGKDQG